jgi:hypothetical protein
MRALMVTSTVSERWNASVAHVIDSLILNNIAKLQNIDNRYKINIQSTTVQVIS